MSAMRTFAANNEDPFANPPKWWLPKELFVSQHRISITQFHNFRQLIQSAASEREIEQFLSVNKEILALSLFLFSTGHHATWIYPKQPIRPAAGQDGGMIPDYMLAGASSDGMSWWVLELKGAKEKAFITKGKQIYLSNEANRGVCQLARYIDAASRSQTYLRDELKLKGFREPNGILLIGTDDESQKEPIRDFKGAWNRINPRLHIRSYSALVRLAETKCQALMK